MPQQLINRSWGGYTFSSRRLTSRTATVRRRMPGFMPLLGRGCAMTAEGHAHRAALVVAAAVPARLRGSSQGRDSLRPCDYDCPSSASSAGLLVRCAPKIPSGQKPSPSTGVAASATVAGISPKRTISRNAEAASRTVASRLAPTAATAGALPSVGATSVSVPLEVRLYSTARPRALNHERATRGRPADLIHRIRPQDGLRPEHEGQHQLAGRAPGIFDGHPHWELACARHDAVP